MGLIEQKVCQILHVLCAPIFLRPGQLSEEGVLALAEAAPASFHELTRFQAIEERTWNVPVLAGGLAFVRNGEEMACYDLKAR